MRISKGLEPALLVVFCPAVTEEQEAHAAQTQGRHPQPSKYSKNGYVDSFKTGYMANATLPHMCSLTPGQIGGTTLEIHGIDEYVQTDLSYLRLLEKSSDPTLVGVQSNQFHRALDLAAYAKSKGVHESAMNAVVLGAIAARRIDQREWPGKGQDRTLYDITSIEAPVVPPPANARTAPLPERRRLADLHP